MSDRVGKRLSLAGLLALGLHLLAASTPLEAGAATMEAAVAVNRLQTE